VIGDDPIIKRMAPEPRPKSGPGAPRPDEPAHEERTGGQAEDSAILHILLNLAFAAGFAYFFYAAGELPDSRWEPLGSGTFPRIVLGCLMVLNVIMVAMKLGRARAEVRQHGRDLGRIVSDAFQSSFLAIATFALFGLFLLAISPLGFTLSAFLFILVLQILLGPITVKGVIIAFIVAAVTAFGLDYVFETYFNVFLPQGRLWR
jgi:putative tricarboxylic transport membrane protein